MRIIARLDIKNNHVIKGIHLEGLRKVGDPIELACRYYEAGIDELLFMDAVASLYDRNNLFHLIEKACKQVFIPITIGGGIRSISDIEQALMTGADKVAINTATLTNPNLISEAAKRFGNQCVVASVEAKKKGSSWEAYVDNGRNTTGKDAVEWAKTLQELGAGEIIITSVDKEGTKKGFDTELCQRVNQELQIPVILSGGLGDSSQLHKMVKAVKPSAIACASVLHYNLMSIADIQYSLIQSGVQVRSAHV